ncbi:MAG TPA: SLC13 family permease [Nakamurella multipartita]|nr:SLC13 family permease [Nakamurella multipartita]
MTSSPAYLLTVAAVGILALLILIIKIRLDPFVSLLLVSAAVAIAAGIPLIEIVPDMENGMGKVLAHVAPIVGLGAMLGKMLEVSGGAQKIADRLLKLFGEHRAPVALGLTGLVFGIPVFFDVGIIVLAPVVYAAAKRGGKGMLYYALPLAAGLAIVHGLLPPHPGPVAAAGLLNANMGLIIVFGLICAVPAWILGGLLYSKWIAKRIYVPIPDYVEESFHDDYAEGARPLGESPVEPTGTAGAGGVAGTEAGTGAAGAAPAPAVAVAAERKPEASFLTVVSIILLPIVLILLQTFSGIVINDPDNTVQQVLAFVGAPLTALLIAVLVSFYVLGVRRGWSAKHLVTVAESAIKPVGMILLVVGAGGVFGSVLVASGVGDVLSSSLTSTGLPLIVLAFVIALALRIAQGSATVAIVATSGIIAALVEQAHLSPAHLALICVAMGAGATSTSHVNDAGYWLVSRYFGISEKDTLKSWTVLETIMGFTAFGVAAALSLVV